MKQDDYVIISDATTDLAIEHAQKANIKIIAMPIELDCQPYSYSPCGGDISIKDFYDQLRAGKTAHTSQINVAVYSAVFEEYLKNNQDVIYIAFSSGLSNTILAAKTAIEELSAKYPERKIYCVDSLCASVGEGLMVYFAAQKRDEGLSIDELYNWVLENRLHLCHWFTVEDLEYLRKGGRISATAAAVGTMIQIKPVMHVDDEGHLINVSKVRGRKKSLTAMVEAMKQTFLPDQSKTVFIGHGDSIEDANFVKDHVLDSFPDTEIHIMPIGPIIGAHTGPGVIALFFIGTKR